MAENGPGTQGSAGEGGALSPSPLIHRTDLWVMAILLVFCGVTYYLTTTFDEVSLLFQNNIPPTWFPRLLIWTMGILALALPFEHLFVPGGRGRLDEEREERIRPITLMTAGLLVVVVLLVEILGMALATVIVCAGLPLLWGERRPKVLIPFAILFPAAVALLFSKVLNIYFEPGLIGFTFG